MEKMLKDSKITSVFVLAAEEQISHRDISVCDWVLWKLKNFLALSNVFVYFWNEEMWNNDFFYYFLVFHLKTNHSSPSYEEKK